MSRTSPLLVLALVACQAPAETFDAEGPDARWLGAEDLGEPRAALAIDFGLAFDIGEEPGIACSTTGAPSPASLLPWLLAAVALVRRSRS